jgi:hypothetical protein
VKGSAELQTTKVKTTIQTIASLKKFFILLIKNFLLNLPKIEIDKLGDG